MEQAENVQPLWESDRGKSWSPFLFLRGGGAFTFPRHKVCPGQGTTKAESCSSAPFFLSLNFPWWVGWEVEDTVSRWELPSQEPQVMLGVLQWVSGEVWGKGSSSVLHSSALGEAAAFQCLVPPVGHVCV